MRLYELLQNLRYENVTGNTDVEISGITANSDKVVPGDLFIAYKGVNFDSDSVIEKAIENGASAVVCESGRPCSVPCVKVRDGRAVMANLAGTFYGFANKKLKLVAVTGTNGKTTTTYMLKSIFDCNGCKTAVIGTLGILYGDVVIAPELTTPDPIFLHSVFADMLRHDVEYVFMEVSAHALYFDKIAGLRFEACIFTNCTQDHLDFFKDMSAYFAAKKKLFEKSRCCRAIINADDAYGVELANSCCGCKTYGLKNPADVFAVNVEESITGSSFVLNLFDELYDVNISLAARHNVYNALAAATCARLLGVKTSVIAKGLSQLKCVPGRLERVASYNGGQVFVDFAHTPDGLEKSLTALRKLCKARLYCVFGCGGNRDSLKRPVMGEIAARIADFVIITSDNPRYEEPYAIISQIEEGVKRAGGKYVSVTEREVAIEYAINLIGEGDILLIAGKGGENYQEIMGIKRSYSDNMVISKLIG